MHHRVDQIIFQITLDLLSVSMSSLRICHFLPIALCLTASTMISPLVWVVVATTVPFENQQSWLFREAMNSMDGLYDPAVGLLHGVPSEHIPHPVRESSWYAFGLMMRNDPSDQQRAEHIMNVVLDNQYPMSNQSNNPPWAGTFRRSPDEPLLKEDAVLWDDYDPNWREFIGCEVALMLHAFGSRISPALQVRIHDAIHQAVRGEMQNKRLSPTYTNIAIMFGMLLDVDAVYRKDAELADIRDWWVNATIDLFHEFQSFTEYNSPTYYGVDLYGLSLWRLYGSTSLMRTAGAEISTRMWRDMATFYSAPMKNLAGPYDRAYGMDMESYIALVGIWISTFVPRSSAPLPAIIDVKTPHLRDLWFAPTFVYLNSTPPDDVRSAFTVLSYAHDVARQIDTRRHVSAYVGERILLGGEIAAMQRGVNKTTQYQPLAVQWRSLCGPIGTIRISDTPAVDVKIEFTTALVSWKNYVNFTLHDPCQKDVQIDKNHWSVGNINVRIETDASKMLQDLDGKDIVIRYEGGKFSKMDFDVSKQKLIGSVMN